MNDLIIFGNFIFAEVAIYYFKKFSNYKICFIACEKSYIKHNKFHGIQQITLDEAIKKNNKKYKIFTHRIFKNNSIKKNLYKI